MPSPFCPSLQASAKSSYLSGGFFAFFSQSFPFGFSLAFSSAAESGRYSLSHQRRIKRSKTKVLYLECISMCVCVCVCVCFFSPFNVKSSVCFHDFADELCFHVIMQKLCLHVIMQRCQ